MKTQLQFLLSVAFVFITTLGFAQVTATQAGIAVQGIARDANNTVRASQNISLAVRMYYKDANGAEQDISKNSDLAVTTDAFGVFSFVFNVNSSQYASVANYGVFLEIKEDTTEISDEQIQFVPYAIAAANGVPTGAIRPFLGEDDEVPSGWLLCDGNTIPDATKSGKALADLLGDTKTPNLIGRFLTGAGEGYTLKQTGGLNKVALSVAQLPSHSHGMDESGNHRHKTSLPRERDDLEDGSDRKNVAWGDNSDHYTDWQGNHTHSIHNTGSNEAHENRPPYFAVNYIIKL